jgi:hypothetical protein
MQSPLSDDFGYLGNQHAIDAVLDGSYQCPADTPEYVKQFIAELKRPDVTNLPTITGTATTEDHREPIPTLLFQIHSRNRERNRSRE